MLYLGADNVFRSTLLDELPWVTHGFGTVKSPDWPGDYTRVKQTHSDVCFRANGQLGCIGEGDALVLATPGTLIGVRTADCVPILLADPSSKSVAAVHAGWRGTAQHIAGKTVQRMRAEFGSHPSDLIAVIGPAIGECCFEVGLEVADQFRSEFPERAIDRHVDLVEANRRQLLAAGLCAGRIDSAALCTKCDGDLFHSFRRDREASGRMVAAIGIR